MHIEWRRETQIRVFSFGGQLAAGVAENKRDRRIQYLHNDEKLEIWLYHMPSFLTGFNQVQWKTGPLLLSVTSVAQSLDSGV
jgi:hypothetical protein